MTVEFRSIEGTEAAVGIAGNHTIIADRPSGKAGGMSLGFNGGQLLALAIGGCLCNDLRYIAHQRALRIVSLQVTVSVEFDGEPLLANSVDVRVQCELDGGMDPESLVAEAIASSTVANSISRGLRVNYR